MCYALRNLATTYLGGGGAAVILPELEMAGYEAVSADDFVLLLLLTEGVWGSGCIDPHFLDLGTSWRKVVSFTPRPLYTRGKSPRYPLDRSLGGPQSRSGR
jgi:hypothetical protein